MEIVLNTIINVVSASWDVLFESSLFILFGFFVAGLLKGFIPDNFIQKHLGSARAAGIFKASLFGVPIPLCSCGVIPAAAGLREQGASKGAVTSFMISTPETGVDSIAVTYALLDPIMTIARPVSAFFTAIVTGVFVNFLDGDASSRDTVTDDSTENSALTSSFSSPVSLSPCSSSGCGCSSTNSSPKKAEDPFGDLPETNSIGDQNVFVTGWLEKFKKGMAFAFGDLLNDIGPWLLGGIMLAGIITVYISPGFIESYLGDGILSMVIMIALATPLYVCATASTPIAAALALKGVSPGAARVFLLAGPATNMATITVVSRLLGRKTALIYVTSIMTCSLVLGLVVNYLYIKMGLDIAGWVQSVGSEEHGFIYVASAVLLLVLVAMPWLARLSGIGFFQPLHHGSACGSTCGCTHK